VTPAYSTILWEYKILFNSSLLEKQLWRKTRLRVNRKTPESNTSNSNEYLLRVELLEDYTDCVEKRAREPWITQEMISKIDKRRKRKNVNTEEGTRNYRRLRNELERATEKIKVYIVRTHVQRLRNFTEQTIMI
jgi:hypothetical protein